MFTFESLITRKERIAVVGLGYVGLPLAVHLSRYFNVIGYDLKEKRVDQLNLGKDVTLEVSDEELRRSSARYTADPTQLSICKLIIVAVPTPIDSSRNPDLRPLKGASATVGRYMVKDTCVVFESTVYPGATEEICIPIMEKESGLTFGRDFTVGYSPERINPGDKEHSLDTIVKVVSGSDPNTLHLLTQVYGQIVPAGIHPASSIKVAEAAKVIENTQRDLNIALMNELALIFDKIGIDTLEVLEAAGTKWNFMPFRPGLVGGHCIGVDPYYLTYKAESLGYHPEMILAGRRINDGMSKYIAEKTVKLMINAGKQVRGANVAVLGLTFKEDVPDLRNTRVVDIIKELESYGIDVCVHDPLADPSDALTYYGIELVNFDQIENVDAVIVAVRHKAYLKIGLKGILALFANGKPLIVDIKGTFKAAQQDLNDILYWTL